MYQNIYRSIMSSLNKTNKKLIKKFNKKAESKLICDITKKEIFFVEQLEEMYNTDKEHNKQLVSIKTERIFSDSSDSSQKEDSNFIDNNDIEKQLYGPSTNQYEEIEDCRFNQEEGSIESDGILNNIPTTKSVEGSDDEESTKLIKNDFNESTKRKEENKYHKNKDIQPNNLNQLNSISTSNQILTNLQEHTKEFHYKEDLEQYGIIKNQLLLKQIKAPRNKNSKLRSGLDKAIFLNKIEGKQIKHTDIFLKNSNLNGNNQETINHQGFSNQCENVCVVENESNNTQDECINNSIKKNQSICGEHKRHRTPSGRTTGLPPCNALKNSTSILREINANSTNKEKLEDKKSNQRISVEIDHENSLLTARIEIIKESPRNYDNLIKYLLCRIKSSLSKYVVIYFDEEVRYSDDIINYDTKRDSDLNDYCVKEITFFNNSSCLIIKELVYLLQRVIFESRTTELIINKFSLMDLQEVLKLIEDNLITLNFLRIEETNDYNKKLFSTFNLSSVKCISIYNSNGVTDLISNEKIKSMNKSNKYNKDCIHEKVNMHTFCAKGNQKF